MINIVIFTLFSRDPNLQAHHNNVVQAINFIFKSLGIKAVPYIAQVGFKIFILYFITKISNARDINIIFSCQDRIISIPVA